MALYICRVGLVSALPVPMSENALVKRALQADRGKAIEWHTVEVSLDGTVSVHRLLEAVFCRCQNLDGQQSPVGRSLTVGDVVGIHDGSGWRDCIVTPTGFTTEGRA